MSSQARRLLILVYASSFLIFSVYPSFLVGTQTRVLGDGMTDHISHWGSTILLGLYGPKIYRVPTQELCLPAPEAHSDFINCHPYRHPSIKPFGVNWTDYPRVYPPGFAVLGVVPALLHVFTPLSFDRVNLVMMFEILFVAHLASMALFLCLWRLATQQAASEVGGVLFFLVMPVLHLQLITTALMGIYDPLAILCVVLSVKQLAEGKPVPALLAMSGGLFLHFRALWQLPLLVVILVQVYRQRHEWWNSPRARTIIGASAAMLLISGICFLTIMPMLKGFRINNTLHWSALHLSLGHIVREWLFVAALVGALAYQRHWMTLALIAWQIVMLVQTRQMQIWHPTFILPIFAAASCERRGAFSALSATFVFFIWESWQSYGSWVLTGRRLAEYVGL